MNTTLLLWDIYEITSDAEVLKGVMLRGRIRKFGIEQNINILTENASDIENGVRFAVLNKEHAVMVTDFVQMLVADCTARLVLENIANPVLSKLKVNNEGRYVI